MIRSAKLREGERWQEDSKKVRDGRRGGFQIVGLGWRKNSSRKDGIRVWLYFLSMIMSCDLHKEWNLFQNDKFTPDPVCYLFSDPVYLHLGIYPMSQASSFEELEFPLLFFGSMFFIFFLQAVAFVWLVTPPEDETAGPNSDPFTGQWTRSQRLFEDIYLCRAHLRYHLFQKISSKSPSSSCKNL